MSERAAIRFQTKPNMRVLGKLGVTDLFDKDAAGDAFDPNYKGRAGLSDDGVLYSRQGQYIGRIEGDTEDFYKKLLKNKSVQRAASDAGFDKFTKKNAGQILVNQFLKGNSVEQLRKKNEETDAGLTEFDMNRLLEKDRAKYDRKLQSVRNAGLAEVESLRGEYNVYSGLTQGFFSG